MDILRKTRPKAFIFEKDFKRLFDRAEIREERGNLFGLWTTEGEPVIHIIAGPDCCLREMDPALSLEDFSATSFPLEHIGNWRYWDSEHVEPCLHSWRLDRFVDIIFGSEPIMRSSAGIAEIVCLPNSSPLGDIKPIKEIARKCQKELINAPKRVQNENALEHSNKNMLSESDTMRSYIFQEDRDILVHKLTQEREGNLFGLWTSDGEAVIHVICGPNRCPLPESNALGILGKRVSLEHIGNWRYSHVSSPLYQRRSGQLDPSWCSHKHKETFFDLVVSNSAPSFTVLSKDGKKSKIKILSDSSPFKDVQVFKAIAIKGKEDDFDLVHPYLLSRIKALSLGEFPPVPGKEVSCSFDVQDEVGSSRSYVTSEILPQVGSKFLDSQGYQSQFTVNRQDFKVFMFEEDYEMVAKNVLNYPNLETGGDLFGLWTTEGNAVLHVVLGPGQNCRRTGVSFFQDVPYLKQNGELLTQDYMLCHIGEWHSHHQLSLFRPSGGDSTTVIRNYPRGLCGFLLIIANILPSHQVQLSPYLYTQSSRYDFDQKGTIVKLRAPNTFKAIWRIKNCMENGKETSAYWHCGSDHDPDRWIRSSHETSRCLSQTEKRMMRSFRDPVTYKRQQPHHKRRWAQDRKQVYGMPTPHYPNFGSTSRFTGARQPIKRRSIKARKNRNSIPENRPLWRR